MITLLRTLKKIFLLCKKDIVNEFRSGETLSSMVIFVVLVVTLFGFTLHGNHELFSKTAPELIWIILIFAGLLGLNSIFLVEKKNNCMEGLLLCPITRSMIFISKLTVFMIYLITIELIMLPLILIFLKLHLYHNWWDIFATLFLGAYDFAILGIVASAMIVDIKGSTTLVSILLIPLLFPVVLNAIMATDYFLNDQAGLIWPEIRFMLLFGVMFTVLSNLFFDYLWGG